MAEEQDARMSLMVTMLTGGVTTAEEVADAGAIVIFVVADVVTAMRETRERA